MKSTGKLIDRYSNMFECVVCGQTWYALLKRGGGFKYGHRMCPNGCKHEK